MDGMVSVVQLKTPRGGACPVRYSGRRQQRQAGAGWSPAALRNPSKGFHCALDPSQCNPRQPIPTFPSAARHLLLCVFLGTAFLLVTSVGICLDTYQLQSHHLKRVHNPLPLHGTKSHQFNPATIHHVVALLSILQQQQQSSSHLLFSVHPRPTINHHERRMSQCPYLELTISCN